LDRLAAERGVTVSYDAPFAGIKVIDLSQGIAAPYAAILLAQYGAGVIKIEPLDGGDWVRASAPKPGGNTALSVMGNIGKQSIGLDLKSPGGRAVFCDCSMTPTRRGDSHDGTLDNDGTSAQPGPGRTRLTQPVSTRHRRHKGGNRTWRKSPSQSRRRIS
jgi:hypothetical protein